MKHVFTFFLRLLVSFLAAKFLTRHFGLEGLGYWLGLTLAFLANIYFFDYLDYRGYGVFRRRLPPRQDTPSEPSSPPPSAETPPEA
jgi:hypothetical protein